MQCAREVVLQQPFFFLLHHLQPITFQLDLIELHAKAFIFRVGPVAVLI